MNADGDEVVTAHFEAEASSAGAARRFVSATLASWGFESLEDAAILLANELVANVVLHAGTDLDVLLRRPKGRLRVEVHDHDRRLPTRKHYSVTATTGRGLGLVDDLARDWGAETTAGGKVVWFELDEGATPLAPMLDAERSLDELTDLDGGPTSATGPDLPRRPGPAGAGRPLASSRRS